MEGKSIAILSRGAEHFCFRALRHVCVTQEMKWIRIISLKLRWDPCEEIQRLVETNPWAWQSIGALSGLVGGVLCPVLGTLLIGATHFMTSEGVVSFLNVLIIVCFLL